MFSDFYEKFNFKKTTPEEKKDVVKNTGDWFPEEHDNKIKGMEDLIDKTINGAKEETMAKSKYKNCKECGKVFEQHHFNELYCCNECRNNASNRQAREYYAKKTGKLKKVSTPNIVAKKGPKIRLTEEIFDSMKELRNDGASLGYIADKYNFNVKTVSIAMSFETYDEFNKQRRSMAKMNSIKKEKPVEQPDEQPVEESKPQFDSLDTLKKAVEIVQAIKSEEDVKLAVDKTYELLKKYITE